MKQPAICGASASKRVLLSTSAAMLVFAAATPSYAQSNTPIKIGVIAEAQAVAGSSIPQAAQLAADEINAAGGVDGRKIEIISYDNHSSAAESVRAFQRRHRGSRQCSDCQLYQRGRARARTMDWPA
jgi:branched-chain amino acid transport system substrate-binding protein